MNPTVIAAAIGVGGTVIVGITGFWASVRNTSKTVSLAREGRIWDKRAEVYADAISALQSLLGALYGFPPLFSVRDYRSTQDVEELRSKLDALETRLQAWASDSVLAEIKAHPRALSIVFSEVDPDQTSHSPRTPIQDYRQENHAISDLQNLIELMRAELQGRRSGSPGRWWRLR